MVSNFLSSVDYELYCWNRISYDRCMCVEVVSTCSYLQIYVFFSYLFHLSMSFCCVTANFPSSYTEIFSTFPLITPYCYSVHTHSRHYITIFINCFVWMLIQYLNPIPLIKLKKNAHTHTHTHTHNNTTFVFLSHTGTSHPLRNVPLPSQVVLSSVRTPSCSDFI